MRFALGSTIVISLLATSGYAFAADGATVYSDHCAICHDKTNPKIGDKATWAPLIGQGEDAMVATVIQGKGKMKPRAGKPSLTDEEIRAAVQYIESKSK